MPTAITLFGVANGSAPAIFAYGFFRVVRGRGAYPAPTLPSNARKDGIRRIPLDAIEDVALVTWDKVFEDSEADAIEAELDCGRLSIPQESPIEPGSKITGQAFGPVIIMEFQDMLRPIGTGVLLVNGIAVNGCIDRVTRVLNEAVGAAKAPAVLAMLIGRIAEQSGLGTFFLASRRIGVLDNLYRKNNGLGIHKAPFDVGIAQEMNSQTKEPMHRVRIWREAAALAQAFRIQLTIKHFDSVINDLLLDLPAGQQEVIIEANTHVTDVVLHAFDEAGEIADQETAIFIQGFNFGITVEGGVDELPPLFAGAPESKELESRRRVHPNEFEGPSTGDRAGGLDGVRRSRRQVDALIGPLGWSGESVWFERGGEGQVEVVRWIKARIEKPGIAAVYLVDPYLGSAALQRVIARQGSEKVTLTIVVSPGGNDPDADAPDTKATHNYLGTQAAANEWSDRLCGRIKIINIQRGTGTKPAFHDRYLCLIDQQGVPCVYLLSKQPEQGRR